ncbi:hypothetical protein ACFZDF_30620 [Streptomyces sp. NPDC007910]|uniref:hypothetical protein n=1 Tax=Streptomyces sp. NPDC007910 TaxID=3364790 RepID=UPI0036F0E834
MTRTPGLCAACKRGACEDCYAVDHPDTPRLYSCLCQERGQYCPRPAISVPDPDADLLLSVLDIDPD